MRPWRALTLLCLCSLTAACADRAPVIVTEYQPVRLPARLLQDCDSPVWAGGTFRDLAELAVARREALEACNRQLKAAREYQTGL